MNNGDRLFRAPPQFVPVTKNNVLPTREAFGTAPLFVLISVHWWFLTFRRFHRKLRPMNSILDLSPAQLRRAANLREQIDRLQAELVRTLGGVGGNARAAAAPKKRGLSPATIAKIRAAAKARWAKKKARGGAKPGGRKLSAAAKARLAAIARARWKRAKAEGRMAL